jgi:hypothetical protein
LAIGAVKKSTLIRNEFDLISVKKTELSSICGWTSFVFYCFHKLIQRFRRNVYTLSPILSLPCAVYAMTDYQVCCPPFAYWNRNKCFLIRFYILGASQTNFFHRAGYLLHMNKIAGRKWFIKKYNERSDQFSGFP